MTDYGHDPLFGVFITPTNQPAMQPVDLAIVADRAGLDLATFQDHPYQPRFHDTWTLLSYVAARTERILVSGNVLNLPLRDPAVLARSAASLDLLSGGRFELGIGSGGFWDAIEAMGGRRLTPGQGVQALDEAIQIIRGIWATKEPGRLQVDGEYYQVSGAKRGPAPAHDIGVWIGAYKPRMLRLTGRAGDGWLPSLGYLKGGPSDLEEMNKHIDDSAERAGRDPRAVRRMLNISGQFTPTGRGLFSGSSQDWAEHAAALALTYGTSGFILAADDPTTIQLFASEVAPAARELIAAERGTKNVPEQGRQRPAFQEATNDQ
ncbi:LLM class flavin-dependent oxidoreductase [Mycetocola sp.]|uniref:LLM class flavin-dependent oxidoreductase n=1 Tax=Mycetocola sp. TaxID=1871042 RepID=UPI003989C113